MLESKKRILTRKDIIINDPIKKGKNFLKKENDFEQNDSITNLIEEQSSIIKNSFQHDVQTLRPIYDKLNDTQETNDYSNVFEKLNDAQETKDYSSIYDKHHDA